ncbi:mitochondrial uncoupling protein 2 [Agrilus planipennis]|uniref:Mitochondrial uncoupling protein 2 n=1 Tax=Agrilus planipennis TaxID=224129 RepID=A0A1W4XL25_AGRPL|nr:mitochondrial uncoupling protein 2 [Agrilus planipennis]
MSTFDNTPLFAKLLTAGTSACFADFVTYPLDTAKVRLQIQGESRVVVQNGSFVMLEAVQHNQNGLFGTLTNMIRQEGPRSLYSGLSAGLQRQMCFASVRIGLYDTFKTFYQRLLDGNSKSTGNMNIGSRVAAGITTGGLAVFIAQPTDVVKVRFQASMGQSEVASPRYNNVREAYKSIASKEGLRGLWKGTFPNVSRNAIVNVSEIVCYDLIKDSLLHSHLMSDGIRLYFISAVIAGFCTTIVASPVDVVKTRYMNSTKNQYKGAIDCAVSMFVNEGAKSFYKGFIPSFYRLVSWNIMMWLTYEQLKSAVFKKIDTHK